MLNNVVIGLLGDEDPRVRHVAAASLLRYIWDVFSGSCALLFVSITTAFNCITLGGSLCFSFKLIVCTFIILTVS